MVNLILIAIGLIILIGQFFAYILITGLTTKTGVLADVACTITTSSLGLALIYIGVNM